MRLCSPPNVSRGAGVVRIMICLLFLTMIVVAVLYGLRQIADSVDLVTCLAIWGAAALVEIGIAFTWEWR
jgi:hypothetical protein